MGESVSNLHKGQSINDICTEGGGGGHPKIKISRAIVWILHYRLASNEDKWEEAKNQKTSRTSLLPINMSKVATHSSLRDRRRRDQTRHLF